MEMIRLLLSEEAPTLILQRFNLGFNTAEMKSAKDNLKHPYIRFQIFPLLSWG